MTQGDFFKKADEAYNAGHIGFIADNSMADKSYRTRWSKKTGIETNGKSFGSSYIVIFTVRAYKIISEEKTKND